MILRIVLDSDDSAIDARFGWFGARCWILMTLKVMLGLDDFEDDAGF